MQEILLPQSVHIEKGEIQNQAQIVIEPCSPGFGVTLGNALRRVLLSSLSGAAVIGVRIKGVLHEFSTIPHIKEDVMEILLNLKELRLKVFSQEVIRLVLRKEGEQVLTAADFEPNSDVEIANPELQIATLTHHDAKCDMEVFVAKGRGYITNEIRGEERLSLGVGVISVDSIFTPVRKTGFRIEEMRVGKMTNYERLILELETDGTISPENALKEAAEILIRHFQVVALGEHQKETETEETSSEETEEKQEVEEKQKTEEAAEEPAKKKRGRPKKISA